MVSLGQKLKMPKTCEKPFYKKIRVVLWENRAKNTLDSRNEKILKIGLLAKAIAHPKAIALQNGQFGSKIKNAKNMRKTIVQKDQSCSIGKASEKHPRFEK